MSTTEGKVVVLVTPIVTGHEGGHLFAARFPELGLTAYGTTEDEAWSDLQVMYRTFIAELRRRGILSESLNKVGAKWYWAEDYPDDWSKVMDTTILKSRHWNTVKNPRPFDSLELVA